MKTDKILAASKTWAKENGFKVSAKILKSSPKWVKSEDKNTGAGISVMITGFGPEYFQAEPCEIWISDKGGKNYFLYESRAIEVSDFNVISDVEVALTDAVELHLQWGILNVIKKWTEANNYELDCDGEDFNSNGVEFRTYEYGIKDDPTVQGCFYPSMIGYSGKGNLIIQRKIAESREAIGPDGAIRGGLTGSWWKTVASTKKTTRTEIRKWLDENAKTGLYADILVTNLDKKTAKRIIRENSISPVDIHLCELESATDDAIKELCKFKGTLHLSEKSFLVLTDSQIEMLVKSTKSSNSNALQTSMDLVIEIGIFLTGSVSEALCKKIAKHSISRHGNGRYIFNENLDTISDKCAAILAHCKSGEIEFMDLISELKVEKYNSYKSNS